MTTSEFKEGWLPLDFTFTYTPRKIVEMSNNYLTWTKEDFPKKHEYVSAWLAETLSEEQRFNLNGEVLVVYRWPNLVLTNGKEEKKYPYVIMKCVIVYTDLSPNLDTLSAKREMEVMRKFASITDLNECPNLVKLYGCAITHNDAVTEQYLWLFEEYIQGISLDTCLRYKKIKENGQIFYEPKYPYADLLGQIVPLVYRTLFLLKKHNILHNDLHPANIMLEEQSATSIRIVIIDWEWGCIWNAAPSSELPCGTNANFNPTKDRYYDFGRFNSFLCTYLTLESSPQSFFVLPPHLNYRPELLEKEFRAEFLCPWMRQIDNFNAIIRFVYYVTSWAYKKTIPSNYLENLQECVDLLPVADRKVIDVKRFTLE